MTEIVRPLPQATEIEQAVLGACLIDQSGIAEVSDILKPEAFADPRHVVIWEAITKLYRERAPIDILTVTVRLKAMGRLEVAGGAFYVASLTSGIASGKNLHYHALVVIQQFVKREQIRIGSVLVERGYSDLHDPFDSLADATSDIRVLNEYGSTQARTMADAAAEVVNDISPDRGVRFGFDALEDKQIRLEPGTVTIIGARPAMGKTAFMLSCAWRQVKMGHRPYIAELEMKDRNLARRLVCGEAGVPVWKSKRKLLTEQDMDNMARWHVAHGEYLSRMLVDESSSMTVSALGAKLDRAKRKQGIDVVWVDYIGLLQPSTKQRPGYDRMTAISNELRVLAKDMDLPFAVLAQLSRPPKGIAVKPPSLTDLRDSGEIEQDAEAVIFLHRPKYYDAEADDGVDVIIAKNRDGEDGIARLWFDGPGTRMLDVPVAVPRFEPSRMPLPSAPAPVDWTEPLREEAPPF